MAKGASPTPLQSRHVRLRPPTNKFIEELYVSVCVGDIPWLWRGRRETPDGFRDSFYADNLAQFMIESRRDRRPVGFVSAYDANFYHGFAYLTVVLLPEFKLRIWPLEGIALFLNYLFVKFNLRNVYGRSAQEHFDQFGSGADRFFEVEGRLKGHFIINGEPQDLVLITVSKERWLKDGAALLERIVGELPDADS